MLRWEGETTNEMGETEKSNKDFCISILEVFELEKVSRHHYATQIEKCKMQKKVLEVHGKMSSYRKVFKARSSWDICKAFAMEWGIICLSKHYRACFKQNITTSENKKLDDAKWYICSAEVVVSAVIAVSIVLNMWYQWVSEDPWRVAAVSYSACTAKPYICLFYIIYYIL